MVSRDMKSSPPNHANRSVLSQKSGQVTERAKKAYDIKKQKDVYRRAKSAERQTTLETSASQNHHRRSQSVDNSRIEGAPQPDIEAQHRPAESQGNGEPEPLVSPEMLVDALSGHEDGLVAIAERLMSHYDRGYDAMGEAIIDSFADVQKLFQHVVEAAHMEGAAFEASRRELERKANGGDAAQDVQLAGGAAAAAAPSRHDEIVDDDVKDLLSEAIKTGSKMQEKNMHNDCFKAYETACTSASALLPVDSDHRGRLQLAITRAGSMASDRGCAILRYAMDDVLRSGLRVGKNSLPDDGKRGDCVLTKQKDESFTTEQSGVEQSTEEALASLVEEMKEVMGAPVYENTPLQSVAGKFWNALDEAQKVQTKHAKRLEHDLGKLKGNFLLSRAVSTRL